MTRHREAEGPAYYRHFYMGLLRKDGTPKLALEQFGECTPELGICQWFHFEDHRLDEAVGWLRKLGVKYLRTGLSWADSFRPNALEWFDRQMKALEEFAEFCTAMVRRYGGARHLGLASETGGLDSTAQQPQPARGDGVAAGHNGASQDSNMRGTELLPVTIQSRSWSTNVW